MNLDYGVKKSYKNFFIYTITTFIKILNASLYSDIEEPIHVEEEPFHDINLIHEAANRHDGTLVHGNPPDPFWRHFYDRNELFYDDQHFPHLNSDLSETIIYPENHHDGRINFKRCHRDPFSGNRHCHIGHFHRKRRIMRYFDKI
ncbi:hypothetical protein EDEG_02491 [Edhazardia aedis USNM 41457]|uniref:Uncharacterized protein n=1 Tax=Edhazardia aedis (strain USNM 41457) TaxID=1003232 RepID=J9DP70_EDHAE|nr:hypothetical protein EDEG_02491 [Edhazardia aedis USNM 41457]|eukprot:EJW03132.1 hypothetical protein EDEG_02491 [Edhazardia aedis USNM 41457]